MLRLPHALVALAFSPTSDALLDTLEELRAVGTERVTLATVLPERPGVAQAVYGESLAGAAVRLRANGFRAEGRLVRGATAERLIALADEVGADLIVMGSRGDNLLRQWVLGSVAREVLRRAEIPVLMVRIEPGGRRGSQPTAVAGGRMFRRILLATDGSEEARAAERAAQALAERAEHAVFLTVLESGQGDGVEARALLEQLARAVPVPVTVRVERGAKASDVIRRVALEERATLVVVGKRGRGGHDPALVGSTADAVASRAGLPVLMVPGEAVFAVGTLDA